MSKLKTICILSSVLAFGLIFSGCDEEKTPPKPVKKEKPLTQKQKDAIKAISGAFKKVN